MPGSLSVLTEWDASESVNWQIIFVELPPLSSHISKDISFVFFFPVAQLISVPLWGHSVSRSVTRRNVMFSADELINSLTSHLNS